VNDLENARMRIYAIEDGAVRAQALAFALRIGLFDRLENEPMTFERISELFSLQPRVLPALLSFLSTQGLLRREEAGSFSNTTAASVFLVRSSPDYVGGRSLLFQGFYDAFRHLPESLASGRPWTESGQEDMFSGFSEEDQRWFAEGMFSNAAHGAKALLEVVDFREVRNLLDVGGNAGGYAIRLAIAHPHLHVSIFDLEPVAALAREKIAGAGTEERVSFVPGSFFRDPLPKGHDAVLLSSILHDWPKEECLTILRACHEALPPGGLIVVTEPMLRDDYLGPDHPSASGLTMVVLGGENRTQSQVCELLAEAGFSEFWCSPVGEQNSVVTARKGT
jgi:3-hydroxy-5-methyl-1-naphthoate 3-O-methyltransferase